MNTETDQRDWRHLLYFFGLALLTCHEMDAVARHEWRLLPGLSSLDDEVALPIFVFLHVPLFTILFWTAGHRSDLIRRRCQLSVDLFLLLHGIAHFAMSGHEHYEFIAPVETVTVYGGAIVGFIHGSLLITRNGPPTGGMMLEK